MKKKIFEKINVLCFLVVIAGIYGTVYLGAYFTRSKYELESLRRKMQLQKNVNESLVMKVNELASLDKVQAIATKNGFTSNNANIKTISNDF